MVQALQAAVESVGEDKLGIKKEDVDVGTHILSDPVAIADCPVFTIMMIGRWSSDAFLRYIRKQVEQFSHYIKAYDQKPILQAYTRRTKSITTRLKTSNTH